MIKSILLNFKAIEIISSCKPEDFSYVTVGYVARKLGVSVPNLSRSFKKVFGITIQYFLIQQKMLCALTLMNKKRKITVKELAAALDYNSTSQFIAAFRKHVGRTPGELIRCPEKRWRTCFWIRVMLKEYRIFNRRRR